MPVGLAASDLAAQTMVWVLSVFTPGLDVVGPPRQQAIIIRTELAEQNADLLVPATAVDLERIEILGVHGTIDYRSTGATSQTNAGNDRGKSTCYA